MPFLPSGSYRKTRGIIRRGTRAAQPLATTVLEGTIYFVTGENVIERSNGTTWDSYSLVPTISRPNYLPSDGIDGEDSFILGPPSQPVSRINEVTLTTTGNIDDLDFGNAPLLRMNNATLATIRGLKAGYSGQLVTILSVGAGQVDLSHDNAGSAAENRLSNLISSGPTPLKVGEGKSQYQYSVADLRWQLVNHIQGGWIVPVFDASIFTATRLMTWTVQSGDVNILAYTIVGRKILLSVFIQNSSIGGTPAAGDALRIAIPGGYLTAPYYQNVATFVNDNSNRWINGYTEIAPSSNIINVYLSDAFLDVWQLSTNASGVLFNCTFELT